MRGFAEEYARHNKDFAKASIDLERERAAVGRSIAGGVTANENDAWNELVRARLTPLEDRKAATAAKLAKTDLPASAAFHLNASSL